MSLHLGPSVRKAAIRGIWHGLVFAGFAVALLFQVAQMSPDAGQEDQTRLAALAPDAGQVVAVQSVAAD